MRAVVQQWLVAGGQPPIEVEFIYALRRYGPQAILERPLGVKEVRWIAEIEHIIQDYRKEQASG